MTDSVEVEAAASAASLEEWTCLADQYNFYACNMPKDVRAAMNLLDFRGLLSSYRCTKNGSVHVSRFIKLLILALAFLSLPEDLYMSLEEH